MDDSPAKSARRSATPAAPPTPLQQGHVHSAVAVYHGKYGCGFLRHSRSSCTRHASTFWHFDNAAKAIGFAVLFDGLDGRIARMTGTSSDFGKELDSLADVITFGVAPAMLAWTWGFPSDAAGRAYATGTSS